MASLTEDQVKQQWIRIANHAEALSHRSSAQHGFPVQPGSPLAGDDTATDPYQVSHAVRFILMSAIDHLHALCALVLKSGFLHLAAPASLARGSLESASAAIWIMSPTTRNERIRRALTWTATDFKDGDRAAGGAGISVPTALQVRLDKLKVVAAQRGLDFNAIKGGYHSTTAVEAAEAYVKNPIGVLLPWRLSSGYAHGRRWPYLGFASTMQRLTTDNPNVETIKFENDLSVALFQAWAAESTVSAAVELYDLRATAPFTVA